MAFVANIALVPNDLVVLVSVWLFKGGDEFVEFFFGEWLHNRKYT